MPVLTNIRTLACCPANDDQGDIGLIEDAALVWRDGVIVWAGPRADLPSAHQGMEHQDAGGALVIPGLVDCHTHLAFGGWRGDEFAQRIAGASYLDIARTGGGIRSTVQATRSAGRDELVAKASAALRGMLALGVTTVEAKSGYGLDFDNEIKLLEVYAELNRQQPVRLVPTFLGAHIIPPEYETRRQDYVSLLCEELIPAVAERQLAAFCDVYVDEGAFTVEEGRRILDCARQRGLRPKIHAEQIAHTGAASLAAAVGAVSAEHLERVDAAGIRALAEAGTVAVTLPLASAYLGERYTDARALIEAGVPVAVATDFNPGSAPSYHLHLALLLACLYQRMTPAEALKGATHQAARAIDRSDRIGSLTAGYRADFALIDAADVNHWLYHFRPNACLRTVIGGTTAWAAG